MRSRTLDTGGGCEIRTHGRLPVGSFQDCWFKPLTQTSEAAYSSRAYAARSEEHTSELQSPCNLVCRLLLEKKKKKTEQHQSSCGFSSTSATASQCCILLAQCGCLPCPRLAFSSTHDHRTVFAATWTRPTL